MDSESSKRGSLSFIAHLSRKKLCRDCDHIDLSPLIRQPSQDQSSSSEPASTYEEKSAIYISHFALKKARKNTHCSLCTILAECAERTGQSNRLLNVQCRLRPKFHWSQASSPESTGKATAATKLVHTGQIHVWFHELKTYNKPDQSRVPGPWLGDDPVNSQVPQMMGLDSTLVNPELATSVDNGDSNVGFVKGASDRLRSLKKIFKGGKYGVGETLKSALASWMIDIMDCDTIIRGSTRALIPPVADAALLRQWLHECSTTHSHAHNPLNQSPRIDQVLRRGVLRAINTSTGEIETQTSLAPFATLSYVWGKTVHLTPSLESKPVVDYAPTIRDAAELAKSIGIEWLWVDRLCINQDDETEKSFLIPYIRDIFAAAQLTIISAAGDGAHNGLPGTDKTPRAKENTTEAKYETETLHLLPARPSFNALYEPCVWRRRGWTFEEQVFSSRVLYIFPSEIIYSCCKGTFRESSRLRFYSGAAGSIWGDNGAAPPIIAAEINAKIHTEATEGGHSLSARDFVRAVEEYTSRNLTIEEDRVIAFAGLVTLSSVASRDQVPERGLLAHGHPLRFFETALTWQHEEIFEKRLPRPPRRGKPFAPSWSWASAGTKVHFLDNGEENDQSLFFNFSFMEGGDILGLPNPSFHLPNRLGLNEPSDILQRQPWLGSLSAPPMYSESLSPTAHSMSQLPSLHLVTVVFDGLFVQKNQEVHTLVTLGNDQGQHSHLLGSWSVDISDRTPTNSMVQKLFAIVAGNLNIYVMALHPVSKENTYRRFGLLRVSFYDDQVLFGIMRKGNPRWKYISIV